MITAPSRPFACNHSSMIATSHNQRHGAWQWSYLRGTVPLMIIMIASYGDTSPKSTFSAARIDQALARSNGSLVGRSAARRSITLGYVSPVCVQNVAGLVEYRFGHGRANQAPAKCAVYVP